METPPATTTTNIPVAEPNPVRSCAAAFPLIQSSINPDDTSVQFDLRSPLPTPIPIGVPIFIPPSVWKAPELPVPFRTGRYVTVKYIDLFWPSEKFKMYDFTSAFAHHARYSTFSQVSYLLYKRMDRSFHIFLDLYTSFVDAIASCPDSKFLTYYQSIPGFIYHLDFYLTFHYSYHFVHNNAMFSKCRCLFCTLLLCRFGNKLSTSFHCACTLPHCENNRVCPFDAFAPSPITNFFRKELHSIDIT